MTATANETTAAVKTAKPRRDGNWKPAEPEMVDRPDFGVHAPDLPFSYDVPDVSPSHADVANLVNELIQLMKGDMQPFIQLVSPELPIPSHQVKPGEPAMRGMTRPDLFAALQDARDALVAVREELWKGPRRTYLQDGEWRIEQRNALEEARSKGIRS